MLLAIIAMAASALAQGEADTLAVPNALARREGMTVAVHNDSISVAIEDSLLVVADSLADLQRLGVPNDLHDLSEPTDLNTTVPKVKAPFVPDPKKAMWMAIVLPGGGQIYNRKYWKLPLVYGGFLGCAYALTWNNTMYRDYSQAYIDIMDSDPNTKSYMNFVPVNYDVEANKTRLTELFRKKKDFYRRYRDMSVFVMIGVYALSVVDAYVDAELSSFDITPDLSMKVHPTIINDQHTALQATGMNAQSYGLQCSFSF